MANPLIISVIVVEDSLSVSGSFTATSITGSIGSSVSSSWASASISSSTSNTSVTSSYALGVPTFKCGIISGSLFTGNPRISPTITFTRPFKDNNYTIVVMGETSKAWSVQSKTSAGFVINTNNKNAFTNLVFWQAAYQGEYYS